MKRILPLLILFVLYSGTAQDSLLLEFRIYLDQVRQYHPVARQANLLAGMGAARLQESRGAFDPKIEVNYGSKEYQGKTYYDRLNAAFKIPTWYGVEFKGQFEQNEGDYLNPSEVIPSEGLYSAGVSLSLAKGLWTNERMAALRKARFFEQQTKAERDLLLNQIIFDASQAYFVWVQAYLDELVYKRFLENANIRLNGVRQSALSGEIAAIDTVEARIALDNRKLSLEQARVRLREATLNVSNFLWGENDIPLELRETVKPEEKPNVEAGLALPEFSADAVDLENHPKLRALEYKIRGLEVDKRLKVNQLLPEINLEYNFLTETPDRIAAFETQQYKGGLSFKMPLFLRKERGALRMAQFKLQDARLELDNTTLGIRNKVASLRYELSSFDKQNVLVREVVLNYERLLQAEDRKFGFGESSLFLLNSRERSLIDARLKANEVQYKYQMARAKLFQVLALNPETLY
jgi:outer membrane protein TolC